MVVVEDGEVVVCARECLRASLRSGVVNLIGGLFEAGEATGERDEEEGDGLLGNGDDDAAEFGCTGTAGGVGNGTTDGWATAGGDLGEDRRLSVMCGADASAWRGVGEGLGGDDGSVFFLAYTLSFCGRPDARGERLLDGAPPSVAE